MACQGETKDGSIQRECGMAMRGTNGKAGEPHLDSRFFLYTGITFPLHRNEFNATHSCKRKEIHYQSSSWDILRAQSQVNITRKCHHKTCHIVFLSSEIPSSGTPGYYGFEQ
ncbi:hypothetical protein F511_21583 [Dorcoceras hygrometricum]|uniref:Uncharacterized protein n=1 Tax=Dorcoceras hygrometricum TaxID=472368 RepID=A0A2Z7DEX2_9LAMI|nr:hypothetical protein F511_21583 [Dorcoceras hygrometricum]